MTVDPETGNKDILLVAGREYEGRTAAVVASKGDTPEGRAKVIAENRLTVDASGRPCARFRQPEDMASEPDTRIELAIDGKPITRASSCSGSTASLLWLWSRERAIARTYGLGAPWDAMKEAPAVVRQHRGMVAAACQGFLCGPEWDAEIRDMLTALEKGEDWLATRRNEYWCAYFSPADGSGQPFVVSLPEGSSVVPYPRLLGGCSVVDMAGAGNTVWHIDGFSPMIARSGMDAHGQLLDWGDKPFGEDTTGIAWDGRSLWVLDNGKKRICEIEKAN